MATVYLAQDIRHDRQVAIKVLRPELAAVIGAERFLSEINTTANLQHPHILPLFDSGEADGFLFYVMPYVEGRDGPRPDHPRKAAAGGRRGADRLGGGQRARLRPPPRRDPPRHQAREHPAARRPAPSSPTSASRSPASTAGTRMTETGMSLGTPHYMSPEQAMGEREITARSDVYALGCVLYEMLVGEPPFTGPTAQSIIARVMTEEPRSLTVQRKTIPQVVEAAVLRRSRSSRPIASPRPRSSPPHSREKPPRSRRAAGPGLPGMGIDQALPCPPRRRGGRDRGRAGRGVVSARDRQHTGRHCAGGIRLPARRWRQGSSLALDQSGWPTRGDGRGGFDRREHVVIRDLGSTELRTVVGTEGARDPSFSPDGQWLVVTRNGQLQKVPVAGGPATVLVDSVSNSGGAWGVDGHWLDYTSSGDGLWRVSAEGGTPERLTTLDTLRHEFNHWNPQALPGGKAVIFTSYATPLARARVEAVDLATGRRTVLVEGAVFGRYAADGYLLYARDAAVFAVRFDPRTLEVQGTAVPVIEDVAWRAPTPCRFRGGTERNPGVPEAVGVGDQASGALGRPGWPNATSPAGHRVLGRAEALTRRPLDRAQSNRTEAGHLALRPPARGPVAADSRSRGRVRGNLEPRQPLDHVYLRGSGL